MLKKKDKKIAVARVVVLVFSRRLKLKITRLMKCRKNCR
jgi:hypothetical protein